MLNFGVPVAVIVAALVSAAFGEFLRWLIIRKWARFPLHLKTATFPQMCPVCLSSNPNSAVDEESRKRSTAYYVVAQKLEWWGASVPHCLDCTAKLSRDRIVGFVVAGACVAGAFLLMPPSQFSYAIFCYILFGYPAYAVANTIRKGIVFGRANSSTMWVYVKRGQYYVEFAALNGAPSAAAEIPLSNKGGVWVKRRNDDSRRI